MVQAPALTSPFYEERWVLKTFLWVYFFSQIARDYGGPRREFFRLILAEIKEKYFDKGIRELLADDYYPVGVIMGTSHILSCIIESSSLQCYSQY